MSKSNYWFTLLALVFCYCPSQANSYPREDRKIQDEHAWEITGAVDYVVRKNPLAGLPEQARNGQVLFNLRYYGERFFIDGEIGYTLFVDDHLMINLISGPSEDWLLFNDDIYDMDIPELEGLNKRRFSMNGGVEILFDGKFGEGELQVETDISGRHHGQSVFLNYGYTFGNSQWEIRPQIGAIWKSSDFVDYHYGVSPTEARPGRPEYQGRAGVDWTALLESRYALAKEWNLVGIVYYEKGASGIVDSPIVEKDYYLEYSVGVEWVRPFSVNF